jgi:hypothetical protein
MRPSALYALVVVVGKVRDLHQPRCLPYSVRMWANATQTWQSAPSCVMRAEPASRLQGALMPCSISSGGEDGATRLVVVLGGARSLLHALFCQPAVALLAAKLWGPQLWVLTRLPKQHARVGIA